MKVKLLKRLRRKGRNQIHILSVTKESGMVIGMCISYSDDKYSRLFHFGNTEEQVLKKAETIYIEEYLNKNNKSI